MALGVACHQSTPEFFMRVLRAAPTAADFERTIANVLGRPRSWLEELHSMGGLDLVPCAQDGPD